MGELRTVYLPRWMTGLGLAFLLPMWGFVTYRIFFAGVVLIAPPRSAEAHVKLLGWTLLTVGLGILVLAFLRGGQLSLVGAGVAVAGAAVAFSQAGDGDRG